MQSPVFAVSDTVSIEFFGGSLAGLGQYGKAHKYLQNQLPPAGLDTAVRVCCRIHVQDCKVRTIIGLNDFFLSLYRLCDGQKGAAVKHL